MSFLKKYNNNIHQLCKHYRVEKLYVFGSAVKNNLSPTSDIDLLVKFKDFDLADYFGNYIAFKQQLGQLLHRDIDLVEEQALKNPILIPSINKNKELIYG